MPSGRGRLYHSAQCATMPNDCISVWANNDREYVMLTLVEEPGVGGQQKVASIDLTPSDAIEFGIKMIEAALLAEQARDD